MDADGVDFLLSVSYASDHVVVELGHELLDSFLGDHRLKTCTHRSDDDVFLSWHVFIVTIFL